MEFSILLNLFGAHAMFTPEIFLIGGLAALYYVMTVPAAAGGEAGLVQSVTAGRKLMFVAGCLCFYIGFGGPLNVLGHLLFSAHMLQQSILYLLMPPLILAGLPRSFFQYARKIPVLGRVYALLTKPVPALLLFNFFFSVYHWPPIFDLAMSNFAVHNAAHLILLVTAFCMWTPILSPLEEGGELSGLKKIGFIFMNGILLTPACACIIFASSTLYKVYTEGPHILCTPFYFSEVDVPRLAGFLSPYEDQQLGGVIMKIMQEIIYGVTLALVFFGWYRKEKREEPDDDVQFRPSEA